jgi:hypothetical protein
VRNTTAEAPRIVSLTTLAGREMKMQSFVMPAWMAGIQVLQDASGDIHVNLWIPALHAGTTQSSGC